MAAPLAEALYARAKAVSALYSLIGGATAPRFYPGGLLPQNPTYPAVTAQVISEGRFPCGGTTGHAGLVQARVQLTAFAEGYRDARTLVHDGLIAAFVGCRGTFAGLVIQETSLDQLNELGKDTRANVWAIACDFTVTYEGT